MPIRVKLGIKPSKKNASSTIYERDPLVKAWTLQNANGTCELCNNKGPFKDKNGSYFLEVHHIVSLADGGSDIINNTVALCPNCHRMCHYAMNKSETIDNLRNRVERLSRSDKRTEINLFQL